jgi:hypothetical protein
MKDSKKGGWREIVQGLYVGSTNASTDIPAAPSRDVYSEDVELALNTILAHNDEVLGTPEKLMRFAPEMSSSAIGLRKAKGLVRIRSPSSFHLPKMNP